MRARLVEADDLRAWMALREQLAADGTGGFGVAPATAQLTSPEQAMTAAAYAAWLLWVDTPRTAVGLAEARVVPGGPGHPPEVWLEVLYVSDDPTRPAGATILLAAVDRWARVRGARTMVATSMAVDAAGRTRLESLGFAEPKVRILFSRPLTSGPTGLGVNPGGVGGGAVVPHRDAGPELEPLTTTSPVEFTPQPRGGRPGRVLHWMLMTLGAVSLFQTDIWSNDPFRGGLLVLVDVAFFLYVIVYYGVGRYRRNTRRPPSLSPLLPPGTDADERNPPD
ncbi:MAG: hypothetical protein AAF458_12955 [Pseudomonadota bacterium]